MKDGRICETPDCTTSIGEQSITGLCARCYGYIWYWQQKTPTVLIRRAKSIQLYRQRLNFMLPTSHFDKTDSVKPELRVMPGQVRKFRRRKVLK